MPTINTIDDVSNIRSIGAAVTANAGAIAIQNVNGALKQVDDQGTVSSLGGGGGLNQLTGDVTAGPGTGSQAATLANLPATVLATRIAALTSSTAGVLKTNASGTISDAVAYTDYLPGGDWYATEAKAHAALALGFTASVPVVPGLVPNGGGLAGTVGDAGKEGGAIRGLGGSVWNALNPATPYQNIKTSKWALSFQGSFATIASSQYTLFGVGTTGGHVVGFGTNQAVDASHFYLTATDGVGTAFTVAGPAADTNVHTWRLVSDATTVTLYMDGVSIGTGATSATHFPTDAGGPVFIGTTAASGQALYRVLYSYIGN